MGEMKETKTARKGIVIALGIVCIILSVSLVGVFAYYIPMVNSKNSTISSLNSQVTEFQNQTTSDNTTMTNLQNQLNSILNESSSIGDIIMSDPSAWVNRTVIVEGMLAVVVYVPSPWMVSFPFNYELTSNGTTIGVSWSINPNYSNQNVLIVGIVTTGWATAYNVNGTLESVGSVIYFIEAEAIDIL